MRPLNTANTFRFFALISLKLTGSPITQHERHVFNIYINRLTCVWHLCTVCSKNEHMASAADPAEQSCSVRTSTWGWYYHMRVARACLPCWKATEVPFERKPRRSTVQLWWEVMKPGRLRIKPKEFWKRNTKLWNFTAQHKTGRENPASAT